MYRPPAGPSAPTAKPKFTNSPKLASATTAKGKAAQGPDQQSGASGPQSKQQQQIKAAQTQAQATSYGHYTPVMSKYDNPLIPSLPRLSSPTTQ